ncbi:MAG: DICT sensory domain-containing protein [Marmoricola sp.]
MNSTKTQDLALDPALDPALEPSMTIGDLADRTGLSPATLRMWETRHGFPLPHRLESGHRRYRDADVEAIRTVMRHKDAGTRLELAIAAAMAEAEPAAPSIYAYLRRRHPHLGVHRLKKSTLLALSWAIEDEFCAKADKAMLYGSFQRERYYRHAEPRWNELARVSAGAVALAAFDEPDLDGSPVRVNLPEDAPMRREWAVVCDSRDLPVVLTAWELPGQVDVRERDRLFESMWTVEGAPVRDAARVCAAVAVQNGADPERVGAPTSVAPGAADVPSVTNLFNRMVAYVDRIDD